MSSKTSRPAKISKKKRKPQNGRLEPIRRNESAQQILWPFLKAWSLLVLAGAYSPISQLTLSPVYGSIPSSLYHNHVTTFTFLLAWIVKSRIHGPIRQHWSDLLPVLASAIPPIQFYIFQSSRQLGPIYGPVLTEVLTYCPLVLISILSAADVFDTFDLGQHGHYISYAGPGLISYVILSMSERVSSSLIEQSIGSFLIFTRSGLQFLVTASYAILLPSKFVLLATLVLLHTLCLNVHSSLPQPTGFLENTLKIHQFSLVDRQESLTGYLSVLDNLKDGFRVLRCDHSLLGGVWDPQSKFSSSALKEPVYSIFVTLEAVRLVASRSDESRVQVRDSEKNALVIIRGLGIGTTPSALMAHGINATVIEVDPVVYKFATKYFGFPSPNHVIIQDAITFVEKSKVTDQDRRTYDYIIHDVFTGGAEPVELFTQEFLQGLSDMLSADGVIAINYAGDLLRPSAGYVVRTVKSIFPACRLYREDADPTGPTSKRREKLTRDFTNMVIFCRKSSGDFSFRRPVDADFLGTHARKHNLWPRHEIDAARFDSSTDDTGMEILTRAHTKDIEKYQKEGAVDHWRLMRTVLPDAIWENW